MREVRILCGGYGYAVGPVRRAAHRGDIIPLPEAEAARLVSMGAAAYAARTDAPGAKAGAGAATDAPESAESVRTVEVPPEHKPAPERTAEGSAVICAETAAEEEADDGEVTQESLLAMTKRDLLALAGNMGLDAGEKMSKAALARLILEADAGEGAFPAPDGSDIVV